MGNYGRYADYVAEFFETTADVKTIVKGLPAGQYKVSASGFYREKSFDNDIQLYKDGGDHYSDHAKLVAIADGNRVEANFKHVSVEHGKLPGVGTAWTALDGDELPWSMGDAAQYFETGLYRITTDVITVGTDGQMTIGVEKPNSTGNDANWIVFDNFRLTYLGPTSVPVTVTSAGYATFCSSQALDFTGKDIKAYVGTREGSKLTFTPITKVPAETGLLLVCDGGKAVDVPVVSGDVEAVGNNCLKGVLEQTTITADDYILNVKGDGAGFYKAGSHTTLGANRAYIPASVGGQIKSFTIDLEDDATGIQDMDNVQTDNVQVYNLAGQRIGKAQKGVNIINGKKVILK